MEAPSNNEQSQHRQMQSFGYALAMNLLWCWSHWCLEEESRMKSCVLESLFVLRICQYIGVFLETTDIKHLYFGTKWPWTLASQNSRHCTVQSLGSPRTGPRSFAGLFFFVLRCWSERSQEQLNQLLSTWMLFLVLFLWRIDTKMIRRQKWLILMDVSRSCFRLAPDPLLILAILRLAQPVVVWTST